MYVEHGYLLLTLLVISIAIAMIIITIIIAMNDGRLLLMHY